MRAQLKPSESQTAKVFPKLACLSSIWGGEIWLEEGGRWGMDLWGCISSLSPSCLTTCYLVGQETSISPSLQPSATLMFYPTT